jgi:hypothetical protein
VASILRYIGLLLGVTTWMGDDTNSWAWATETCTKPTTGVRVKAKAAREITFITTSKGVLSIHLRLGQTGRRLWKNETSIAEESRVHQDIRAQHVHAQIPVPKSVNSTPSTSLANIL